MSVTLGLSPPTGQKADGAVTAAPCHPQGPFVFHPLLGPEDRVPTGSPSPAAQPTAGLPGVVLSPLNPSALPAVPLLTPISAAPSVWSPSPVAGCPCVPASLKRQTWKGPRRPSSPTLSFFRGGRQPEPESSEGKLHRRLWQGPGPGSTLPWASSLSGLRRCNDSLTGVSLQPWALLPSSSLPR